MIIVDAWFSLMEKCGGYKILQKEYLIFFETKYGIPYKDISLIKNVQLEEDPDSDFEAFHAIDNYCKSNSLDNPNNYNYIASKIDIKSLIDFYSNGFYLGIYDWPNRNYLIWRNNGNPINGNEYSDGKWRFGAFDFDYSAGLTYENFDGVEGYAFDSFQKFELFKNDCPTTIFIALMRNNEFLNDFSLKLFALLPIKFLEVLK